MTFLGALIKEGSHYEHVNNQFDCILNKAQEKVKL